MNAATFETLFRWTTALVGWGIVGCNAQMQAFISYEGEQRLILDANREKFTIPYKNREKQIYKSAFELRPHDQFADGLVQIGDLDVDLDPLRDATAKERSAPRVTRFRFEAIVEADRSLKDAYAILCFVSDGSVGTFLHPLGTLSKNRSRKVEIKLPSQIDAVGSLHIFTRGMEVRTNQKSEPYDAAAYFENLTSEVSGIPALVLTESQRRFPHSLSRDGQLLATRRERNNREAIIVYDLDEMKLVREVVVDHQDATSPPLYPTWVGNEKLAFVSGEKLWVLDVNSGEYSKVKDDVIRIINELPARPGVLALICSSPTKGNWFVNFDTATNLSSDFEDPHFGWSYFDDNGDTRFRYRDFERQRTYYHRPPGSTAWRKIDEDVSTPGLKFSFKAAEYLDRTAEFHSIGPDADTLFISSRHESDTFQLSSFSMSSGEIIKNIVRHPRYDIGGDSRGHSRLLFDKGTSKPVGLIYEAATTKVLWFSPKFKAIQSQIDQALPDHTNLPLDWSENTKTFVYYSFNADDPGTTYVLKPDEAQLIPLQDFGARMRGKELGKTQPIVFPARDGEKVYGYLTTPPASEGTAAPLIVIVHGGPTARDTWSFDPMVQFLATRGYYVLKVNYRGSSGYGSKYQRAGLRQRWDTVIIDDIADALLYVKEQHNIDGKRVGIMGSSFGGWATYISLAKYPELYHAGVATAAVAHWRSVQRDTRINFADNWGSRYWRDLLDQQGFDAVEPFIDPLLRASEIKQPIFIIHGERDRIVQSTEAGRMLEALQKTNNNVRSLSFPEASHSYWPEKDRVTRMNEIGRFFEEALTKEKD